MHEIKIGCSTVVFRREPLEKALYAIRNAGFEYCETQSTAPFCPHVDVFKDDPISFSDRIKSEGFLGVTALWMPDGQLLTNEKSVDSAVRAIEWAGAAGIGVVNTGDGFKTPNFTDKAAMGLLRRRLSIILEEAAKNGVYLAIEPHGTYSLTSEGLKRLLSLVDSPWLGVNFDAANICRAGYVETKDGAADFRETENKENELDVLESVAERVVHYHVKDIDSDRKCVALGEGEVKNAECIRLLKRCDYIGAYSLETEGDSEFEDTCELCRRSYGWLCEQLDYQEKSNA